MATRTLSCEGTTDTNRSSEILLYYIISNNLVIVNSGNELTFVT